VIIKVSAAKKRGLNFQKIDALKNKKSIKVGNAVVLTGANGSGKTTIIDSVALSSGLAGRYSSSHTQKDYQLSSLDFKDALRQVGGLTLYEGRKKLVFDLVLRYRGEEARVRPMALDTMEDVMMCFRPSGSHGEVNGMRLLNMLKDVEEQKDSRLLFLFDEPEAGLSLEICMGIGRRLQELCKKAVESKNLKVMIATQNPFILFLCEAGGATRLDLGKWIRSDPFEDVRAMVRQHKKGDKDGEEATHAKEEAPHRS
jgi:predicted ATPase